MANPISTQPKPKSPSDDSTDERESPRMPGRRVWDPNKSSLVEEVLTGLVELYRQGEIQHQIYPGALLRIGGIYESFYRNAFLAQPEWSVARFPEGWRSFVKELNQRLADSGISVIDTRRAISSNAWLPDRERNIVRAFSRDYRSGNRSRDEVLLVLKSEFGIELREGSLRYYFPAQEVAPRYDTLDKRKDCLAARIQDMKKEFNLDLRIARCVQGLVFEQFVGVVLRALNPEGPLESQTFRKIDYRDLSGKTHYSVYPDWVCGEISWEVKLRNNAENILESALPQAIALGHRQTVVYREQCEEFAFMMENNIRLDDILETMGLLSERTAGMRIRDLIDYTPVTDLLAQLPSQHVAHSMLKTLDAKLGTASCETMWEWIESLERISSSADQLEARLSVLASSIDSGVRLTKDELSRLFGPKATRETRDPEGLSRRITAITRELECARDKLLLSVYNTAYHAAEPRLLEQHVRALEDLPPESFSEAAFDVLATLEHQSISRIRRRVDADPVVREKEILAAFEATERLRLRDLLQDLDELDERARAKLESAQDALDAYFEAQDKLLRGRGMPIPRWMQALRAELKTVSMSEKEVSVAAHELMLAQQQVLESTARDLDNILNELRALERTTGERSKRDWNIDPDTSAVHKLIAGARAHIDQADINLQEMPFAKLVHALAQRIDTRKANLSSADRSFITNYRTHLSCAGHRAQLNAIETIVDIINYHAATIPGLGYQLLASLVQDDADAGQSAIEERIQQAIVVTALLTTSIFSNVSIGLEQDGQTLRAARDGRIQSVVDAMTARFPALTVLEGATKQTGIAITDPNDLGLYVREAALLWESDTIKDALLEAERRIRDLRGFAWISGVQLIKAVVDGNSISMPPIPEGGGALVTVDVREVLPTQDREAALSKQESCLDVLDHAMVIQKLLGADLWSRRVAQARRIACIDKELAVEFIRQCMQISPDLRQPFAEVAAQLLEAATASDSLYEGLVGMIHGRE